MINSRILHDRLLKAGLKHVMVHDCLEDLCLDKTNYLEKLIMDGPGDQVTLLRISDGMFVMETDYRYLLQTKTFTISGHVALEYELIDDLLSIEKECSKAFSMIHKQLKALLSSINIHMNENEHYFNLGYGRYIDGSGSLFFYTSNEYNYPDDNEIPKVVTLLIEETAISVLSLSSLFDVIRTVITNQESSLTKILSEYFGDRVGCNNDLIRYFLNEDAAVFCSPDIESLRKGDELIGIGSGPGNKEDLMILI